MCTCSLLGVSLYIDFFFFNFLNGSVTAYYIQPFFFVISLYNFTCTLSFDLLFWCWYMYIIHIQCTIHAYMYTYIVGLLYWSCGRNGICLWCNYQNINDYILWWVLSVKPVSFYRLQLNTSWCGVLIKRQRSINWVWLIMEDFAFADVWPPAYIR